MQLHYCCVLFVCLLASGCAAATSSSLAKSLVDTARTDCTALDNGSFKAGADYIVTLDLDGDGERDELLDESHFTCSSSASLFTPNGGYMLHAIVHGAVFSWQVNGWRIVDWGEDKVLLLAQDGTECGGHGYQPCYEAVVFNAHRPMTVRPGSR